MYVKYDIWRPFWLPQHCCNLLVYHLLATVCGRALGRWWALQQRFQLAAKGCCKQSEETAITAPFGGVFATGLIVRQLTFTHVHFRDAKFVEPYQEGANYHVFCTIFVRPKIYTYLFAKLILIIQTLGWPLFNFLSQSFALRIFFMQFDTLISNIASVCQIKKKMP